MAKKNYDLLFKLLLIGDSGVGKVSRWRFESIDRCVYCSFRLVFYFDFPMIHSMHHLSPQLELISKSKPSNSMVERLNYRYGKHCMFQIGLFIQYSRDTAGQERFHTITSTRDFVPVCSPMRIPFSSSSSSILLSWSDRYHVSLRCHSSSIV